MNLERLVKKFQTKKNQRGNIEASWDEVDYFCRPLGRADGAFVNRALWDFTAMEASLRFAAAIASSTATPVSPFAKASWQYKELREDHGCVLWAEDTERAAFAAYEDSNFYVSYYETIQELVDHGGGFLIQEAAFAGDVETRETFRGLRFTGVPCREAYFEPDHKGGVRTFFRMKQGGWLPSEIVDLCEERGWPVPEDVQKSYDEGEDTRIEIVWALFPRPLEQRKWETKPMPALLAPEARPWGCVYFRNDTGEALGPEGGYYHNPVSFAPFDKKAGSEWGFGPSQIALPTVKYLNERLEQSRIAGEVSLNPPALVEERGLLSDFDRRPGGLIVCRDPDKVKPFVSGSRYDVDNEQIRDLREQIKDLYHYDDLKLRDSPAMTATEVQARLELMQRILGPLGWRVQAFLSNTYRTTVAILMRIGIVEPMPDKARKMGGLYALDYMGALARAQKTDEVAAIERFTSQTAGLSQYFPEATAILNASKMLRAVATKLGVPADCLNSEETIKKIVAEQKAQSRAVIEADVMRKQAAAAKDASAAAGQPIPFPGTVPLGPNGVPA